MSVTFMAYLPEQQDDRRRAGSRIPSNKRVVSSGCEGRSCGLSVNEFERIDATIALNFENVNIIRAN